MGKHPRCASLVMVAIWLVAVPASAQPSEWGPRPPEEQVAYERGFEAMLRNDFVAARAGFQRAIELTTNPELRGAANEMLRLIGDLENNQGRLVFGPPPAGPEAPAIPPRIDGGESDPDEGRTGIVVSTTLASIYAGIVFADLADTDDARAVTGIITATTAAGFVASLYGTRGRTIHGGTAEAYSLGLLVGAGNGLLLAQPLGAETSEQWNTAVIGGMALTMGAGFVYGQSVKPTRAQISFAGTMATMGLVTAGLGLVITLPDVESDTVLLTMAAGLDGGTAAGLYLGRDLTWSTGRARLVWLGALLGGMGGLATSVLAFGDGDSDGDDDNRARASAAITLAGAWGGLLLSSHLTRNMRPDRRYLIAGADRSIVPIAVRGGGGIGYAGRF